ncbi:MAG: protease inhibitor I9 family protein, partial [Nanoarchaeota archaeon]|nr:protease inhibitor I9 family protein [Nanoarchaeota archaeon]MBU1632204.1 protease inhibitor I9 family protein [Nanoarchaeota archaeon]
MRDRGSLLIVFVVLLLVLIASSVYAVKVDQEVLNALDDDEEVSVIVVLKDEPIKDRGNVNVVSTGKNERLEIRREMIREVQDDVLERLNIKENNREQERFISNSNNSNSNKKEDLTNNGRTSVASTEDYDFDLKHRYSVVNGFSGKVTKAGLEKLLEDNLVEKVEV